MVFIDFLKSASSGAISLLGIIIAVYVVFYWMPKTLGFYRLLGRIFRKKIPDEIYEAVVEDVVSKEKFNKVAEKYLKLPKRKQKLYFSAYEELKELQKREEDK